MLVIAVEAEALTNAAKALGFEFTLTFPEGEDDYGDFILSDPTNERLDALAAALRAEVQACLDADYAEGAEAASRMAQQVIRARRQ